MQPILLPPPDHPSWQRAKQIVAAFRLRGKANPMIVAALVDAYAESAWTAVIAGDHDQSFGPFQMKWAYYGKPILDMLSIDIRNEPDLAKHVDAVLFALSLPSNEKTLAALEVATNGDDATRIWAANFERASAGGAVERRVAVAPAIDVWLAAQG